LTYGLPTKLSSFVITTANDLPSRDPASYQLYGFNRGSWTLLSSGNLRLPNARLSDSAPVALPSLPSLTQYRLVFPKLKTSANGMQIADLKLYGTQSPALPKPTGIRAIDLDSASSSPATQAAANAFDNRPSSKYLNLGGRNSGLSFTYGLPTKLSSFVITTANDLPSRDPASYQLYGFNRGSWTLLSSGNLQLPNARLSDSAPVALPSLPSLTQYRLVFPKLKTSANGMQIADLKLYGTQSPPPGSPTPPVITLTVSPASVSEDGPANLAFTFLRSGSTSSALTLTLVAGTGYDIGTSGAVVGAIANDDVALPVITLSVTPASVLEDGVGNLAYTFSRTGSTSAELTVNYSVGGSATLGTDYTGINAAGSTKTITFAAGSAAATVTVDPTTDSTVEPDETVALSIASGSGYTIGTTSPVVGTITNDDLQQPPPLPPPPAPPPGQWTYNWANASQLGNIPSILEASVALPSPRSGEPPLALTALRVDLRDPAISLTSTGRRSDWANNTIETTSETSRQYMSRSRNSGLPIVAAINTAPFELDLAKQFLSVPTNIRGFAVSEGQLVSSTDYNGDTFKSTFL
jgi:hypothetical protein